jgi:hypothetical protein
VWDLEAHLQARCNAVQSCGIRVYSMTSIFEAIAETRASARGPNEEPIRALPQGARVST